MRIHGILPLTTVTRPLPNLSLTVSAIVPAYQAAETVGRALKSIANQTKLPDEIIVVDDGSTDGTADIAEEVGASLFGVDVTVLRLTHKGAGAARNSAVQEAKFDYVAFLDADDEWLPEKLERSIEVLEATDSVLVSHDYIRRESSGEELVVRRCSKHFNRPGDPYVWLYRLGYIATSGVVARRNAVLAAGGFDETLLTAQDFALWLSMLEKPDATFQIFSGAYLRYYVTAGSISTHTERRLECTLRIAQQYLPALSCRPGWPVISLWYRVLAVHHEAMSAYLARGFYIMLAGAILRLPINLIKLTFFKSTSG